MADTKVTKNLRDGVLTVTDGASASVVVYLDEGDLSFTRTSEFVQVLDRGALSHTRKGNEVPVPVSFSVKFVGFQQDVGGAISLYEALTQTGGASGWTSDSEDGQGNAFDGVYSVILTFVINDGKASAAAQDTLAFAMFHTESIDFSEGDDYDTLSVSGFAFETTPTIS